MKIDQKTLSSLLASANPSGLTLQELLLKLSLKKDKKTALRKTIRALSRLGKCVKRKNRYYLVRDSSSTHLGKRSERSSKQKSLSELKGAQKGIVINLHHHLYIQSINSKNRYIPNKQDRSLLMHGDEIFFCLSGKSENKKTASLLNLDRHKVEVVCGTLSFVKDQYYLKPLNQALPYHFKVKREKWIQPPSGDLFFLKITKYPDLGQEPEGVIIEHPLEINEESQLKTILKTNQIQTLFPTKVLRECQKFKKSVSFEPNGQRIDQRSIPFITIDGKDAKDFDDAVYAVKEGINYRLYVAIADVSEYVRPGKPLDKEALFRGTSTYLPDFAVPMLPESLSNHLCSLKKGLNRKTLTCEMLIDPLGKVLKTKIYLSLIKNQHRLTYDEVDRFFATGKLLKAKNDPSLTERITLYQELSNILAHKRNLRGSINFNLPDSLFIRDKKGAIIQIKKNYQSDAMKIIEQFMIEANENVGLFCEKNKIPIVWRNHLAPLADDVRKARINLWNLNVKVTKLDSPKHFNKILDAAKDNSSIDFIEYMLLRTLPQARYGVHRLGHFGLAATHYCHFTSPIRRYPDLLCHRAIKTFLYKKPARPILDFTAEGLSDKERSAEKAERSAVKLKKTLFIAHKLGELFEASVSGMIGSGLFVTISEPYIEGFVPFRSIQDDHYNLEGDSLIVRGRKTKRSILIGTRLEVLLVRIDRQHLSPEFEWIRWQD
ncbi:MAG: VacB/RNase II family 3'-5' exoribonuclease [Deltaproteobacteria bacterium]|nr:VacB/RNase II family 3'-5' exoribonuclease [Deltaproteobacteria bacterium]